MLRPTRLLLICSLLTLSPLGLALGQEVRKDPSNKTQIITASVTPDGVRIAAPSAVVQLRLEVYDEAGQKLFDNEQRGGNVLDWHLQGGAGERVADGAYLCVVTIKNLSGRLSQKLGLVTVSAESTKLRPAGVAELSLRQTQAVGPIEGEEEGLTVMGAEDAQPVTVLANNGGEAQLARTRGALTFRNGDFFSGTDKEQMRLTEDGNLGIGTAKPKARLDVAGTIRAREGFVFSDGSKLNVNDKGALSLTGANGSVLPNVAGSGTQDRLTKWADNSGTLGDSLLGESGGGVELNSAAVGTGINPTFINPNNTPGFSQLQAYPSAGPNTNQSFAVVPRGTGAANNRAQLAIFNTDFIADSNNYEFSALRARGSDFVFGTGKSGIGQNRPFMLASGFLSDNTTNNGQLYLATNGNVGIGTTNPTMKLDVAGNVKLSGANSSLVFADGTSMMTAAGGGSMSGTSIVNAVNDPATVGTISDARLSANVARLNTANTFGGSQSVNGNVTATGSITAAGRVESTSGGFKFPDGSVQTIAAGKAYTTFPFDSVEIGAPGVFDSILHLDLPPGSYMVTATVQFENRGLFNKRVLECQLVDEATWFFRIEGSGGAMDQVPVSMHTVITHGGPIDLHCGALDGGTPHSNIFARARRFTAIKLGELVTQP